MPQIPHDVGDLLLLDEALLPLVEEGEGLLDLGFEVLLELGLLREGGVRVPQHNNMNWIMDGDLENRVIEIKMS